MSLTHVAWEYMGSGLQPVMTLVSGGYVTPGTRLIWVARAINGGHGIIPTRAMTEGLVWDCDPSAPRVYVDFCDS